MEHTKTAEVFSHQVHRVQEWIATHDWKNWFRRPNSEKLIEDLSTMSAPPPPRDSSSDADGVIETGVPSIRSGKGPTRAELERLEAGRTSMHSLVFLDDSEIEEIFEPTVREDSRINYEDDPGVSAAPGSIGAELAERMLRSATGNDPDSHH